MNTRDFVSFLEATMDLDEGSLSEDTDLKAEGFMDSLAIISIIAKVNQEFDRNLDVEKLKKVSTVGDLLDFIGRHNFGE